MFKRYEVRLSSAITKKPKTLSEPSDHEYEPQLDVPTMIEAKLAKVSIVIVIVFLLCWAPYVVTRSLEFVGLSLSSAIMSGGACFANKLIMSLAMADFLTAAFPLSYQLATVIDVRIISDGGVLCTIAMIEAKLAKISIVIVIVFLLCWAPYVVTRSLAFVGLSLSSAIMSGGACVFQDRNAFWDSIV
ncbi:hypothetical protein QZH41_007271 [Actinostola sp. cb2023]|nr:hypothetical protein QZH41_007271 [Actinostola sp. cb2023]